MSGYGLTCKLAICNPKIYAAKFVAIHVFMNFVKKIALSLESRSLWQENNPPLSLLLNKCKPSYIISYRCLHLITLGLNCSIWSPANVINLLKVGPVSNRIGGGESHQFWLRNIYCPKKPILEASLGAHDRCNLVLILNVKVGVISYNWRELITPGASQNRYLLGRNLTGSQGVAIYIYSCTKIIPYFAHVEPMGVAYVGCSQSHIWQAY